MHLVDLYRSQGMWDSAKVYFQKVFDWKPENPNFALRLANVATHEKNYLVASSSEVPILFFLMNNASLSLHTLYLI
jgi:hypothetical protein